MKKFFITLSLSAALAMSFASYAAPFDDHDHHGRDDYYDRGHKDWHHWDEHEDRAWRIYWQQRHHAYIDWARANASQRNAYWGWRHDHPDSVLNINIH